MSFAARLKRFGFDYYVVLLLGTVVLATVLPASGEAAELVKRIAYFAVALLFFLYGAKLNTKAILAGIANWRAATADFRLHLHSLSDMRAGVGRDPFALHRG